MIKTCWAVGAEIAFVVLTRLICGPHDCMSNKPEHIDDGDGGGHRAACGSCWVRCQEHWRCRGWSHHCQLYFLPRNQNENNKTARNVAIRQMNAGGERVD